MAPQPLSIDSFVYLKHIGASSVYVKSDEIPFNMPRANEGAPEKSILGQPVASRKLDLNEIKSISAKTNKILMIRDRKLVPLL